MYYISGFDPRGSRFYHRLFREESKKSERISGAKISTGKRKVLDDQITQWQVDSEWEGQAYKIDYRFMTWDDVMKHYWVSNVWKLIIKSIPMYWQHIKIGLFPKFKKGGRGPYFCSVYPLVFSTVCLGSSLLAGWGIYLAMDLLLQKVWLAIIFGIVATGFFIRYAKKLGEDLNVWWILQTYYFISRWINNPLPELEAKSATFARRIIQDQFDNPVEEIVVVGHCTGASLVVSLMSKLLNLNHECLNGKLSVMTLGQSIPYISYAEPALHFREQLQLFANNRYFPWFDMGARADPLCFQQVNPALAEGITFESDLPALPHQFVVKPYKMFSPEKYRQLKKNKLRVHFQYLMASDLKTDFDYFEIVTGHPANIRKYKN